MLGHLSARIIPQKNSKIPDCMCFILLTADTLYVLEDNYDGTYTTHFEIPCGHIKRVEKYKITDEATTGGANSLATGLALAFGGLLSLSSQKTVKPKIFTIILHDRLDGQQHIHFNETEGNIKGFIKAFDKLKAHN